MTVVQRVCVVAAILRRGNQLLLARRPSDKHQGGFWEFAGGKIEPGEPEFQALQRELYEELGVSIRHAQPYQQLDFDYPDKQVRLSFWMSDDFAGHAYGREGQEMRWVSFKELQNYSFPPANAPIVERLLAEYGAGTFQG